MIERSLPNQVKPSRLASKELLKGNSMRQIGPLNSHSNYQHGTTPSLSVPFQLLTQGPQDVIMQDNQLSNVQERLARFWNKTAPEISKANAAPIDHADLGNPQLVAELAGNISDFLLEEENSNLPSPHYMTN